MGLGIDELEIDAERGWFYVHREDGDYWNRYKIEEEAGLLDFIFSYDDENLSISDITYEGEKIEREGVSWD